MSTPQSGSVYEMILEQVGDADLSSVAASPSQALVSSDWHENHQEGQLAVDVADNGKEILVASTMAGVDTERIEVYVHNDLLTIRGERVSPFVKEQVDTLYCQECFWGKFSRTIVLPVHVKADLAKATYKSGVLTVRIPKTHTHNQIPVTIVEE